MDLDSEKAGLLIKYDKAVKDIEKLTTKQEELEKLRKDLEQSIEGFQKQSVRNKQETDQLVHSLQDNHKQLLAQLEHCHTKEEELKDTNERRTKVLVNKLNQLEEEHAQCK